MLGNKIGLAALAGALLLASGVALLVAADETTDGGEEPDSATVMRAPRVGDGGTLVADDGRDHFYGEPPVHVSWNRTSVRLVTGEQRQLPALVTSTSHEETEDGIEERSRWTRGPVFTELPGPAVARIDRDVSETTDGEGVQETWQRELFTLRTRSDCTRQLAPHLVERTPAGAEGALADCLVDLLTRDGDATNVTVETTSRWESGDRFERLWRANASLAYTQAGETERVNVSIATSPAFSLVLETTVTDPDDDPADSVTIRLTEITEGEDPIEVDHEPLPDPPTVGTTTWTGEGPGTGDLELYPVGRAREAVEDTEEGQAFFAEAEQPRLTSARFVDDPRTAAELAPNGRQSGVVCGTEGDPTPGAPSPADHLDWTLSWASPDAGDLTAFIQAPQAAHSDPTGSTLPLERVDVHRSEPDDDPVPPAEVPGPVPAELWAQRDLVDGFSQEGAHVLEVDTDGLSLVDGELAPDEDGDLTGRVGRSSCTTSPTGDRTTATETLLVFRDGEATGVEHVHVERTGDPYWERASPGLDGIRADEPPAGVPGSILEP